MQQARFYTYYNKNSNPQTLGQSTLPMHTYPEPHPYLPMRLQLGGGGAGRWLSSSERRRGCRWPHSRQPMHTYTEPTPLSTTGDQRRLHDGVAGAAGRDHADACGHAVHPRHAGCGGRHRQNACAPQLARTRVSDLSPSPELLERSVRRARRALIQHRARLLVGLHRAREPRTFASTWAWCTGGHRRYTV